MVGTLLVIIGLFGGIVRVCVWEEGYEGGGVEKRRGGTEDMTSPRDNYCETSNNFLVCALCPYLD